MKFFVSVLALVLMASTATAQFVIAPGLGYYSSTTEQGGGESEVSETRIDARVGYVLPMGLYLGGTYAHIGSETCSGTPPTSLPSGEA